MSPWSPSFEPLFQVLSVVAGLVYLHAVRATEVLPRRVGTFVLGLLLVAVPLNSPLETVSDRYLLLMHLLQNAMIADWAPPLLLLGLTPAMRTAVRRVGGRLLERVTRPPVAILLWLASWYGTHYPAFYDWALAHGWPLNLEHAILVSAGLVFWWPLVEPAPRRLSTEGTLAYLGVAFVTSPWLSLALIFSTRPLYRFYAHAPRLWGLSPLRDQNLGGILMNVELTAVFFAVFAYYLVHLLGEEEREQRKRDLRATAFHAPTGVPAARARRPPIRGARPG